MTETPMHMTLAKSYLGIKEVPGKKDNPKIMGMYKTVGHAWVEHDEVAWCAAFVGAMLERAGLPSTRSLAARSYLKWGVPVDAKDAQVGDVVVFKRGNSSWQGHVAFFVRQTKSLIFVLGGNQANGVNIKGYAKSKLLGIRRAQKAEWSVQAVQTKLKKLGYHEVGMVDGQIGPRTKAAILAFRNDNGLPLTDAIDNQLIDTLKTAKPREIGEARASGTPKHSRIVTGSNATIATSAAGLGLSALGKAQETLDQAETGVSAISRFTSLVGLGEAIQPYLPFIGMAIFAAIILIAWRVRSARIEDFQTGKTP